jgi:hypothetical protein
MCSTIPAHMAGPSSASAAEDIIVGHVLGQAPVFRCDQIPAFSHRRIFRPFGTQLQFFSPLEKFATSRVGIFVVHAFSPQPQHGGVCGARLIWQSPLIRLNV